MASGEGMKTQISTADDGGEAGIGRDSGSSHPGRRYRRHLSGRQIERISSRRLTGLGAANQEVLVIWKPFDAFRLNGASRELFLLANPGRKKQQAGDLVIASKTCDPFAVERK